MTATTDKKWQAVDIGITVTQNEAKDGVEIRFEAKPERATLDALKAAGWRWSRFSNCWYAKRSPETLAFANRIAGLDAKGAA